MNFKDFTYENIINTALARVPDTLDKREGSIIYDALAPACYVLAEAYQNLSTVMKETNIFTATQEYLDMLCANMGITRYAATAAVKKTVFATASGAPLSIPLGSRFSTISETQQNVIYIVTAPFISSGEVVDGAYLLTSETMGTIGNAYVGALRAITYMNGLATATMSDLIVTARDAETDDELRARYLLTVTRNPFGGNVAQYDEMLKSISGVGEVQIYSAWNGGGTVKCSIVGATYRAVDSAFIEAVQTMVDPTINTGEGLGMAPIGHQVTITTPAEITVNIAATLTLKSGYLTEIVQPLVEEALEEYIDSIRKSWGVANELNEYAVSIYIARIMMAILSVPGITNVTALTINGNAADLVLTETGTTQQIPVLGTVALS